MRNSGQMTVEAVLIITLFLGLTLFVSNQFRQNEVLSNMVNGPWKVLAGMIQNGQWAAPEKSLDQHPNHSSRLLSVRGENPK